MADSNRPDTASPWITVNETLAANCCWICNTKFKKGTMKKVIMISQILLFFNQIENDNNTNVFISSENLSRCYTHYITNHKNYKLIIENMKASQVEPWMSGLACGKASDCCYDVDLILSIPASSSLESLAAGDNSMRSLLDCPPNCGCDNPWAFIK